VSPRSWDIKFATGSAKFKAEAVTQLKSLFNDLVVASGTIVEIHGHTDDQGAVDKNQRPQRGARLALKKWLREQSDTNFPEERIKVFAHGFDGAARLQRHRGGTRQEPARRDGPRHRQGAVTAPAIKVPPEAAEARPEPRTNEPGGWRGSSSPTASSIGRTMLALVVLWAAWAFGVWLASPGRACPGRGRCGPRSAICGGGAAWARAVHDAQAHQPRARAHHRPLDGALVPDPSSPLPAARRRDSSKLRFLGLTGLVFPLTLLTGGGYALKVVLLTFGMTTFFVTAMAQVVMEIPREQFDHLRVLGASEGAHHLGGSSCAATWIRPSTSPARTWPWAGR